MGRFVYAARDSKGKIQRGDIEADSSGVAVARLRSEGLFVTTIAEQAGRAGAFGAPRPVAAGARINARTLSVFCQQMFTLLRAGVPVVRALTIVAGQAEKPGLRATLERVRAQVEAGESLSAAMGRFGKTFPALLVRLVEAGELSGTLEQVFDRMQDHYAKEHELRQKIVGALTYPMVILCVAVLVVIALLVFVLPNFVNMFSDMNIALPLPTQILLGISAAIRRFWYLTVLVLVGAYVGTSAYLRTETGRWTRDELILRLPVIGRLVRQIEMARFGRTLGTLLAGGIPAVQALQMVSHVVGNQVVTKAVDRAVEGIRNGGQMADSLAKTKVFPTMLTNMVQVGEATGNIDEILGNVAAYYDRETENTVKVLTTLMEPLIIVLVGSVVALIIASVMLPMFEMLGNVSM